ncbi:MAG TPA: histidine phosphatase family protein [Candidatus Paceibacterota bacterium]|nr:histidine phosphatase family protein [Candidatus Paceibacterota bacterium]
MKYVYFVRHGESGANEKQIHGMGHHPLTKKGFEQAGFIAERLSKLPIQKVISSDMLRAKQTAEAVIQKIGVPFEVHEGLGEIRGPSEFNERGINDPEVVDAFKKLNDEMAPGVRQSDEENFDDLIERARKALDLFIQQPEDHLAVVTHGFFLRTMLAYAVFGPAITVNELQGFMHGFKSQNTGLTVLEYRAESPKWKWRIFVWNDHAHLG